MQSVLLKRQTTAHHHNHHRSTVLVYREQLLPYSETFITAQAESCRQYDCWYVGLGRVAAPEWLQQLISRRAILLRGSGLKKLIYRLRGWVWPQWKRSLQNFQPCLIHAHFGPDGGNACALARSLRLPLIVTYHGYDATWQSPAFSLCWRDLLTRRGRFFKALALQQRYRPFRTADRIIAVSHFIQQRLIEMGCPAHKISVHYTGIDLQQFQANASVPRQPIVLFVGRLVEKKGCGLLIQSMAQVQKRYPTAQLVVIGEGPLKRKLITQANECLHGSKFLGAQSPAQVREWMNRAWLLCAPSVTAPSGDAEGLGMGLLEAQAMELPVVANCSGGISEAVVSGKTGILVPEGEVSSLAKAILTVLQDSVLRDRLARAGRAHIKAHFDLKKNTAQLEQLYQRTVQAHHLSVLKGSVKRDYDYLQAGITA